MNIEPFEERIKRTDIVEIPVIDVKGAIARTEINEEAGHLLKPPFDHLLSQQYIEGFALMSAPPDFTGPTSQAMSKEDWQRSLLFPHHSAITYGDPPITASYIQTKGNLRTGRSRNRTKDEIVLRESMQKAPWGFFEYSGAQKEQKISNRLIQEGIPAGLVLGTMILDPEKLRSIIEQGFGINTLLGADLLNSLDIVLENNDVPVIMARLADSRGRLGSQKESDSIINETNLYAAIENFCFFDYGLKEEFIALFRNSRNYRMRQFPDDVLLNRLMNGSMNVLKPYAKGFEKMFGDDEFKKHYADLVAFMPRDIGQRFMLYDFETAGTNLDYYSTLSPIKLAQTYQNIMGRSLVNYYSELLWRVYEYFYFVEGDDPELYNWGKDLDLKLDKILQTESIN